MTERAVTSWGCLPYINAHRIATQFLGEKEAGLRAYNNDDPANVTMTQSVSGIRPPTIPTMALATRGMGGYYIA
jgi:hypothetical protein